MNKEYMIYLTCKLHGELTVNKLKEILILEDDKPLKFLIENQHLIQVNLNGSKILQTTKAGDSVWDEYCTSCECTPCDCSWGNYE